MERRRHRSWPSVPFLPPTAKLAVGCALLLIALMLVWRQVSAPRLGNLSVPAGREVGMILASWPEFEDLRGNLVGVRGDVIMRQAGGPPRPFMGGALLPASYVLHRGNRVHLLPGEDRIEPSREVAVTCPRGKDTEHFVRYVEGGVSGRRTELETALVQRQPPPPRIALTFDDGPSPVWTPRILDLLVRHGARATFFVAGNCAKVWPELVAREVAEGHEVACHSYSHPSFVKLNDAGINAQMSRFEAVVLPLLGGRKVCWFRPPYGAINARVRSVVTHRGYRVVLWDVDTRDWTRPAAAVIANRILSGAKDSKIVLLHDGGGDRSRTADALATVLPRLAAEGVQMVTLSQLKGLEPLPQGELVITEGGREWRGKPRSVEVTIGGQRLEKPLPALAMDGHLLLAAGPVLRALGTEYRWLPEAQVLRVEGVRGTALLRVNSRRATLGGQDVLLLTPVARVEGQVMVGITLLVRITNSVASMTPDGGLVAFEKPAAASLEPTESGAKPAEFGPTVLAPQF